MAKEIPGTIAALLGCFLVAGCGTSDHATGIAPNAVGATALDITIVPLQERWPASVTGTLVFHADREGRHRLFTLNLATGHVTRLTDGRNHHDEDATWSPDGTRVAFTTTRFDARTWDIAVRDTTGGAARRLTSHLAFDRHAAWMPDGRSLLFSSEQEGTQAVFRVAVDSGAITRVSPPPQRALMPAASPDGERVAYTMGTPEGLRLAVQDLATGQLRMVTPTGADVADARWSPDGRRLAYARMLPGRAFIEILTLDSGATVRLAVDGMAVVREPSWSADGRWLVAAASPAAGDSQDWDLVLLQSDPPAAFHLTTGGANDRGPEWMRQ